MSKVVIGAVGLFFALGFCAAAAKESEPPMTKIVTQIFQINLVGDSVSTSPKTLYLAGTKYMRLEEEPDKGAGTQQLVVTNEPDSWAINLADKTGRHVVDEGPKFDIHAPIFWTSSGQVESDFVDLEFGSEMKFFGGGRAAVLEPRKIDGKSYKALSIKTGPHEVILFLDQKTGKPFQIDLHKFGRLVSYVRYLSYQTKLPFKEPLFLPPKDVQLTEQK
ncbi:MAG: hypothetical protein M3Y03_01935 [Verrucomicrobiota bacterium]|nr:hypothetical protein [Verrucomicrobiota bacterium]